MQSQARVVIIGGGAMGIGLLHGLALEGWTDVLLIEKGELTSGSTWHAAGQCPSFIADYSLAKVHAYSNDLYARLEAETQATGWHQAGGIRFATNQLELDYFKKVAGVSDLMGFRMQVISPEEIRRINPYVTTEGVLAGAWTLDDGYVDPSAPPATRWPSRRRAWARPSRSTPGCWASSSCPRASSSCAPTRATSPPSTS